MNMLISEIQSPNRNMTVNSQDFVDGEFRVQSSVNEHRARKRELGNCGFVSNYGFVKRPTIKFQALVGLLFCALQLIATGDAGK